MKKTVTILKALADETRLRTLNLLSTHDLCVGALASRLGISKAAVSQHLKVLRKAGLVRGEKRGYWTHYVVEKSVLETIGHEVIEMSHREQVGDGICLRTIFLNNPDMEKRRKKEMCKCCCEQPDKLKGKPEDCSAEQIKECHGDKQEHPCVPDEKE